MPADDRKIPKSGWYKGTAFHGTWDERRGLQVSYNLVLQEAMRGVAQIHRWPKSFELTDGEVGSRRHGEAAVGASSTGAVSVRAEGGNVAVADDTKAIDLLLARAKPLVIRSRRVTWATRLEAALKPIAQAHSAGLTPTPYLWRP